MSTPAPHDSSTARTGVAVDRSLREKLAAVLPRGHKFGVHHVSTPPTRSEPLCAAPPGQRPDKTFRESHFLAISIPHPDSTAVPSKRASPGADHCKEATARNHVLVFAVEVFIFTTAHQTTLFVSKADSTGYLHLLNLPKGSPSPIRQVCATFLAHLLDSRRRDKVQSVVNLFARAQAQYLFPGSVRNKGKHVLDDWGLVRWWCKALDPLMEGLSKAPWTSAKGYLLVPGLEETEMRALIPRTATSTANWAIGHPLEKISHYARTLDWVPPRCLIPGYPDDPKSRFRDELDEEVSGRKHGIGAWKSVKTLDQFWEMMAFRQECSSGRLTGFIWLVFDTQDDSPSSAIPVTSSDAAPDQRKPPSSASARKPKRSAAAEKKTRKKLTGRIVTRAPKVKTQARNYLLDRPTATAYYYWPPEGRGDKIVDESEYKRIIELLLHLDFSTIDKAVGSSQRWVSEVYAGLALEGEVVGSAADPETPGTNGAAANASDGNVTNLTGLVRRKSAPHPAGTDANGRSDSAPQTPGEARAEQLATNQVNVLGAGLVRKKKKVTETR